MGQPAGTLLHFFYHFTTQMCVQPVQHLVQAGLRSAAAICLSLLLPQWAANFLSNSCSPAPAVLVTAVNCPFLITLCQIFRVEFSTEDHYLNGIIIPLHKTFIYSCSIYISNIYEGHSCCVQIEKDGMFTDKARWKNSSQNINTLKGLGKFDRLHEEEH